MVWGGGGGGGCAAVGNAAAAVAAGYADVVVVFRSVTQNAYARRGAEATVNGQAALMWPYGMISPAQMVALRVRRFMHVHGVTQDALRAVALAAYCHAQRNPRALMHGRPLSAEAYDESRWIVEPFHIYDCCMANDGAAAVIVTSAERARDLRQPPAYVWAAAQGATEGYGQWNLQNDPEFASANVAGIATRLWKAADITPDEVDVVQIYDHFTGGVVMSLCEHGFISPDEANEFLVVGNLIAPGGKLPLNTSGGSIAECNIHGMQLIGEAARQLRGTSTSQVEGAQLSFVNSGSLVTPTSNLLLGASPS
jgi:acetyl-CoA acetyltransferase